MSCWGPRRIWTPLFRLFWALWLTMHSAHPRNFCDNALCGRESRRTFRGPRRRRLRLSRSANAVGAVMCDLGWAGGPFGGPRSTTALPSRAESVREDLFADIATQVGRPRYGAKGVGITYPSLPILLMVSAFGRDLIDSGLKSSDLRSLDTPARTPPRPLIPAGCAVPSDAGGSKSPHGATSHPHYRLA